ncbi:MAG: tetratricopeptide repeat protein [Nitrospirota bacterium]|nr:tetratricopeptide repeat protein [Nitrospirota bacterium]
MKRTIACISATLLLSLGGVAAAQGDGDVDALLKDLEGILTDVMGSDTTSAPAPAPTTAEPTGTDVPMEDVAAAPESTPDTQSADASPAMDEGALEAQLADMMSGTGENLDSDVSVDAEPVAEADSGMDAEAVPEVAAKPDTDSEVDAEAELATMQAGAIVLPTEKPAATKEVATRPTTVAIPDADGMIEMQPATPEVPPAVAPNATPNRPLLAGEVEKLFNQGLSWFAVGEYSRAAARMEEILWSDPSHTEARYYLAFCRYKMGDFKQARAEFHALYQVKYDFTPVRRGVMAELGNTGNAAAVAPAFDEAPELAPDTSADSAPELSLDSAFDMEEALPEGTGTPAGV